MCLLTLSAGENAAARTELDFRLCRHDAPITDDHRVSPMNESGGQHAKSHHSSLTSGYYPHLVRPIENPAAAVKLDGAQFWMMTHVYHSL